MAMVVTHLNVASACQVAANDMCKGAISSIILAMEKAAAMRTKAPLQCYIKLHLTRALYRRER